MVAGECEPHREYFSGKEKACVPCSMCPAGKYVNQCEQADSVCVPCPANTFSGQQGLQRNCTKHDPACGAYFVEEAAPTPTSNRVCQPLPLKAHQTVSTLFAQTSTLLVVNLTQVIEITSGVPPYTMTLQSPVLGAQVVDAELRVLRTTASSDSLVTVVLADSLDRTRSFTLLLQVAERLELVDLAGRSDLPNSVDCYPGASCIAAEPFVSGGYAPVQFSLTGTLPAGMAFDVDTGQVAGTPSVQGTSTLVITAHDARGFTAEYSFALTVLPTTTTHTTTTTTTVTTIPASTTASETTVMPTSPLPSTTVPQQQQQSTTSPAGAVTTTTTSSSTGGGVSGRNTDESSSSSMLIPIVAGVCGLLLVLLLVFAVVLLRRRRHAGSAPRKPTVTMVNNAAFYGNGPPGAIAPHNGLDARHARSEQPNKKKIKKINK